MEKLIELLNERTEEKREEIGSMFSEGILEIAKYKYDEERECITYDDYEVDDTFIIAKKTKFIQRLVDNDKIDLEKLDEKAERKPMYSFEEEGRLGFKLFGVYEGLLMLLAIQDKPIAFLVNILK